MSLAKIDAAIVRSMRDVEGMEYSLEKAADAGLKNYSGRKISRLEGVAEFLKDLLEIVRSWTLSKDVRTVNRFERNVVQLKALLLAADEDVKGSGPVRNKIQGVLTRIDAVVEKHLLASKNPSVVEQAVEMRETIKGLLIVNGIMNRRDQAAAFEAWMQMREPLPTARPTISAGIASEHVELAAKFEQRLQGTAWSKPPVVGGSVPEQAPESAPALEREQPGDAVYVPAPAAPKTAAEEYLANLRWELDGTKTALTLYSSGNEKVIDELENALTIVDAVSVGAKDSSKEAIEAQLKELTERNSIDLPKLKADSWAIVEALVKESQKSA